MLQVKDERISNEKLRKMFYNIPDACTLIAVKQLNFIGKVVRREDSFFPKQLLTAWVITINAGAEEFSPLTGSH